MTARPTLNSSVRILLLLLIAAVVLQGDRAHAQYTLTSLVTTTQDPHLKNGWGIAYLPGAPFWVSDEATGLSTVYGTDGTIIPLVVTVPSATSGVGSPTGIAANPTTGFVVTQNGVSGPAAFIFDTLDGTISGWNSSVNATSAVIAVNNSGKANYTGLAIATVGTQTVLYAANEAKNQIEIYNSSFKLLKTFTDAKLTGLTVYGVAFIKGFVVVTFSGVTTGAVDVFTPSGSLVKTLVPPTSVLKGPWGLALAPSNFDTLSGTLLVGNVDDGRINGFSTTTGKLIGTVKDKSNKVISIPGLWGLEFGGGSSANGNTNQLFFAAGTAGYSTGEFGVINP
jgi:uncharacterized protein (TIGR03118 family)